LPSAPTLAYRRLVARLAAAAMMCAAMVPATAAVAAAPGEQAPTSCAETCLEDGRCHLVVDRCVPLFPADCARSVRCMATGHCALVKGRCELTSAADCALSNLCKLHGKCAFAGAATAAPDGAAGRREDAAKPARCVVGRRLDKRSTVRRVLGLTAGGGASLLTYAGSTDDPSLFKGGGARLGWQLGDIVLLAGADFYAAETFVRTATVKALNKSFSKQEIEQEQEVTSALFRVAVGARYYVLGGVDGPISLYAAGGLALLRHDLTLQQVARKSGYEQLDATPMALSIVQFDVGLGTELQAGPVRPYLDLRFGAPVVGGEQGALDMGTPGSVAIHVGVRVTL